MLKRIINWLLALTIMITAVPSGAAFALPSETENFQQEQLIKQQVIMGYFDVWRGGDNWQDTNNDGVPDARGDKNKKTKPFTYTVDDKIKEAWQITRVEVQYPFTADEYAEAGGRMSDPSGNPLQEMMPWKFFKTNYLQYLPQNLSVSIASKDLANGKAQVQWTLDLEYQNVNGKEFDLKDSKNRSFIGYEVKNIDQLSEGWRWYLPGIIKWYGIPTTAATPDSPHESTTPEKHDNLWVEIIDYSQEVQAGGKASVKARIHNDLGQLLTTRLVWKVNGQVVKDIQNYDLIGTLDDSITFTMPDSNAVVTVEINPDKDRPQDETSYEDNTANCNITPIAVVIPDSDSSKYIDVDIVAPARVEAFHSWNYTVKVRTDFPEPPPGSDADNPSIKMNMEATGQTADVSVGYNLETGYQKINQIIKTDQKSFSVDFGPDGESFTYTYPGSGLWGKPVTVTITAEATGKGSSARDTATVTIEPRPIPKKEIILTQ